MTWNPTQCYLVPLEQAFLVGITWHKGIDAAGWRTWNLIIPLGTVALRIEKGVR